MNRKETLQIKRDLKFLVCNFFVQNSLYTSLLLQNTSNYYFYVEFTLKQRQIQRIIQLIWYIWYETSEKKTEIWHVVFGNTDTAPDPGATKTDLRTTTCYMYADTTSGCWCITKKLQYKYYSTLAKTWQCNEQHVRLLEGSNATSE